MTTEPLTRTERRVYLRLKHFCFGKSYTIARQKTIAADLKLSVPTVKRAMAGLREKGWISTQRRGNSTSKKQILGDPSRRPNKQRVLSQIRINLIPQGGKNDPSGDPSGDPSIHISMEPPAGANQKTPPLLETKPTARLIEGSMGMPSYYRGDKTAERLWKLAQRWIVATGTPITGPLDVTVIMHRLEEAGALKLPDGEPLPQITIGNEARSLVASATYEKRKPTTSQGFQTPGDLRRAIE